MDSPTQVLEQLASIANEVAIALEQAACPKPHRQEARRLLMQAWLVADDAKPDPEGRVQVLARALDRLVAPPPLPLKLMRRLNPSLPFIDTESLTTLRDSILLDRMTRFDDFVTALARRTQRMVEHALAVEAGSTPRRNTARKGSTDSPQSGREDLELVYSPNTRRR